MLRVRFLIFLLAAAFASGCAPSEEEVTYLARKELLQRQNQGIRELIEEEERGSLVPTDRFLIGVDESIVEGLLRSQLPIERPLGKQFVVRLDRASVSLRDKFGVITIDAEIHRKATPERTTALRVLGGLGAVAIDTTNDKLYVDIAIDHVELKQAGLLEDVLGPGGKKFLAEKAAPLIEDVLPQLQIPVVLGSAIPVPAIEEEGVRLDSLRIPLHLSVERVIAAGGKLWVTVHADVGTVTGAEEGLGVVVRKKPKKGGAR